MNARMNARMNVRITTRRALGTFLAVLALLACAPLLAAETVKIGFIEVLSGPFALAGEGSLKQLREVVTQLNAKSVPNDPKFEVVPFDGKARRRKA